MSTHITPPPDAPIPWEQHTKMPNLAIDSDGQWVGSFSSEEQAAYAVAAANALPGLVKASEKALKWLQMNTGFDNGVSDVEDDLEAALAALPKEPIR